MEKSPIKKGTEVNLTIESLAFGGKGTTTQLSFLRETNLLVVLYTQKVYP